MFFIFLGKISLYKNDNFVISAIKGITGIITAFKRLLYARESRGRYQIVKQALSESISFNFLRCDAAECAYSTSYRNRLPTFDLKHTARRIWQLLRTCTQSKFRSLNAQVRWFLQGSTLTKPISTFLEEDFLFRTGFARDLNPPDKSLLFFSYLHLAPPDLNTMHRRFIFD